MTRALNIRTLAVNCDPSNGSEIWNDNCQTQYLDRPGRGYDTVIGDFIYLVILDQIKLLCHFHIYTISSMSIVRL